MVAEAISNGLDIKYATYVVNPYEFARTSTIAEMQYLKDVTKYGTAPQRQKATEMLNSIKLVNRTRSLCV